MATGGQRYENKLRSRASSTPRGSASANPASNLYSGAAPLVFADHRRYSPADVQEIVAAARREQAEWVVTTRKDWVKLHELWPRAEAGEGKAGSAQAGAIPLYRLDAGLVLADPRGVLDARLRALFM